MSDKRATFVSKIGVIAAAAGSAVGLGNIWRFPSQTADGGGAIFILVYVGCILFFGIPLMVSEFMVGRASGPIPPALITNWLPAPNGNGSAGWVYSPDLSSWDFIWWCAAGHSSIFSNRFRDISLGWITFQPTS